MIIDQRLSRACIDIDGVLCRDPYPAQNADNRLYRKFLAQVQPLFQTDIHLGILVSARLQKYRPIVVDWLSRNKFTYKDLVLFDAPTQHVRDRLGFSNLVRYKDDVLVGSGFNLFIQSRYDIARALKQLNPEYSIYCTQTNSFL